MGSWIFPFYPGRGEPPRPQVVVQFGKDASQTRDYCVAKNATRRAARPDPSLRKERLFRMTIKVHHHQQEVVQFGLRVRPVERGETGDRRVEFTRGVHPKTETEIMVTVLN